LRGEGWERVKCQYYFETVNISAFTISELLNVLFGSKKKGQALACPFFKIILLYDITES